MRKGEGLTPVVSGRLAYLFKRVQTELAVLMLVGGHAAESQQQLGQRLGIDRTSTVQLLDRLEAVGLVERRPDPGDRRRNVVELTATGRDVLRDATAASDEAERRLLEPLAEVDQRRLRDLLRLLAGADPA